MVHFTQRSRDGRLFGEKFREISCKLRCYFLVNRPLFYILPAKPLNPRGTIERAPRSTILRIVAKPKLVENFWKILRDTANWKWRADFGCFEALRLRAAYRGRSIRNIHGTRRKEKSEIIIYEITWNEEEGKRRRQDLSKELVAACFPRWMHPVFSVYSAHRVFLRLPRGSSRGQLQARDSYASSKRTPPRKRERTDEISGSDLRARITFRGLLAFG